MRLIPFRGTDLPVLNLRDRMNRLFEDVFENGGSNLPAVELWPPVNVAETQNALEVKVELPGIETKDLEISVSGEILTIKGEKSEEKEEKGKTWYRRECSAGSFLRSIALPVAVDAEHIEAVNHNGILTVTLPKSEKAKSRKIPVKSS